MEWQVEDGSEELEHAVINTTASANRAMTPVRWRLLRKDRMLPRTCVE